MRRSEAKRLAKRIDAHLEKAHLLAQRIREEAEDGDPVAEPVWEALYEEGMWISTDIVAVVDRVLNEI